MNLYRFVVAMLIAGFAWMNPAMAQNNKLQQAKDYFMDGSYANALELLNQTINYDRYLEPEILCEAYYYRGLTYVRLYNEAYGTENIKAQEVYKEALYFAYQDYKHSLEYDNGNYWKQIDLEIKSLHQSILSEGLVSLNEYNNLAFDGKADPGVLDRAENYLVSAHEIRKTYLVCDLLGQVYLDKGEKQEAAVYFKKAEKLYSESPPDEPDFLMAYVFYRLAAIYKSDSIRLAMQVGRQGMTFLGNEHARFLEIKDKLAPERAQQMEQQYVLALRDLENLKYDLYLGNTELYVEALHVFEEGLAEKPGDVNLLAGYASLLEKTDMEKAMLAYQKALEADPHFSLALFNLGVLYYTKGKTLFSLAQETSDNKQFEILLEEAMAYFEKARPYFEQALVEDPLSLETIQALKAIAFVIDDQPSYQKYQDMESELGQ